jgi:hypothetical protein
MVQCPQCHGNNLRRSRTRGWRERLLKPLGWRAYRCREKDCGWRGLIKTKPTREVLRELLVSHKQNFLALGVTLILVAVIWYLIK